MKMVPESAPDTASFTRRKPAWLLDRLASTEPYRLLGERLDKQAAGLLPLSGVRGSMGPLLATLLKRSTQKPLLVVTGQNSFERYEHDLEGMLPTGTFCSSADGLSKAVGMLAGGETPVLAALFDDLLQPLTAPDEARERMLLLQPEHDAGYETLRSFLTENGFESREFVEDEGEFSVRGSIVDIFPFGAGEPVRVEFFGDTITSLRQFDINSQLSGAAIDSLLLTADFSGSGNDSGSASLLEHLPPESLLLIDDSLELEAHEERDALLERLERFSGVRISPAADGEIDFGGEEQKKVQANFRLLSTLVAKEAEAGIEPAFAISSRREVSELTDFLSDEGCASSDVAWIARNLHTGFRFDGISLYTESDIFGKLHAHKAHRRRKIRGISLKDLQKLKVGDYVVHEDYGIGVFKSMEAITAGGAEQECVLVEYEGGDQLFVNVQNIGLLSKYTASEGSLPKLSKLGSSKWAARKEKVRNKLRDTAINLIKLYAQRKMQPGFAFGADSIFMREFESSFIFDETPDQLKAIEEVKKDMRSPHPMDRLICGDAGFGKTEIAMRAAFKAVESKKQAAILTPTTILAHQHYESFKRRFENFPISIVVLSRFVSRAEQKEAIERISKGEVDIVIGTHRLVSKDVQFKDLGLLVIDEEQHFGVDVKEKLREQFPGVDTLTMSATPIPRTLQFSMLGARDLSIVSTPPKNRQPVETVIADYDEHVVRTAIEREMKRDGQVFFLHNRISGLEKVQKKLRELVPGARIVIAHGQMPTRELEKIMKDVMEQEVDVLISTSIIGSGLDISNANTIIIDRADRFGLSDLYQLRGRVGRSERKAWCYMITPPLHTLKREAVQRLAVIESFTELGSGFTIALRDLDIRGAGNLLGAEQSGYIHELGFDLYQKLLEETVAELKTTQFSHLFEADQMPAAAVRQCDLGFFFDALIPEYYISSTQERFLFYDRISKARAREEIETVSAELRDRFGALPEEVSNLIALARLRVTASQAGFEKLELKAQSATLVLPDQEGATASEAGFFQYLFGAVQGPVLEAWEPAFDFSKKMKLQLRYPEGDGTTPSRLALQLEALLESLLEAAASAEEECGEA